MALGAIIGGVLGIGASVVQGQAQSNAAKEANKLADERAEAQFERAEQEQEIDILSRTANWGWEYAQYEAQLFQERQQKADYEYRQSNLIDSALQNLVINEEALYDRFVVEEGLRAYQVGRDLTYELDTLGLNTDELIRQEALKIEDSEGRIAYVNDRFDRDNTYQQGVLASTAGENIRQQNVRIAQEQGRITFNNEQFERENAYQLADLAANAGEQTRQEGLRIKNAQGEIGFAQSRFARENSYRLADLAANAGEQNRQNALAIEDAQGRNRFADAQYTRDNSYRQAELLASTYEQTRQYLNQVKQTALQAQQVTNRAAQDSQALAANLTLQMQGDFMRRDMENIAAVIDSNTVRARSVARQGGSVSSQRLAENAAQALGRTYGEMQLASRDRNNRMALLNQSMQGERATQMGQYALAMQDAADRSQYALDKYGRDSSYTQSDMAATRDEIKRQNNITIQDAQARTAYTNAKLQRDSAYTTSDLAANRDEAIRQSNITIEDAQGRQSFIGSKYSRDSAYTTSTLAANRDEQNRLSDIQIQDAIDTTGYIADQFDRESLYTEARLDAERLEDTRQYVLAIQDAADRTQFLEDDRSLKGDYALDVFERLTLPGFDLSNRQYQRELDSLYLQTESTLDEASMPFRESIFFAPRQPIAGLAPEYNAPTKIYEPTGVDMAFNAINAGLQGALQFSYQKPTGGLGFY